MILREHHYTIMETLLRKVTTAHPEVNSNFKNAAGAAPPSASASATVTRIIIQVGLNGSRRRVPLRVSSTDYDEQTQARTRTRIMTQISGFSEAPSRQ